MTAPHGSLQGVRVLDFARLLPGAHTSMVLADFGADVVKVESPPHGDGIRRASPVTPEGVSGRHQVLNRGKRSICLDLKDPHDRSLALELSAQADVVIESFRPGTMARLGVGYDDVRRLNPGVVYVSLTGFGQEGARAGEPSHDINFLALSGLLSAHDPPRLPPLQVADLAGGSLQAVIGTLLALRARDATGQGQHVDVAMLDGLVSLLAGTFGDHHASTVAGGADAGRLHGDYACYGLYECADGQWLAVGALEEKFWAELVEVLGVPDLAPDHLDPTRQPMLRARLEEMFGALTRPAALALLEGHDVCVSPVLDHAEAIADQELHRRGALVTSVDNAGRPMVQPGEMPRLQVGAGRPGRLPDELDAARNDLVARGWACERGSSTNSPRRGGDHGAHWAGLTSI